MRSDEEFECMMVEKKKTKNNNLKVFFFWGSLAGRGIGTARLTCARAFVRAKQTKIHFHRSQKFRSYGPKRKKKGSKKRRRRRRYRLYIKDAWGDGGMDIPRCSPKICQKEKMFFFSHCGISVCSFNSLVSL